MLCVAKAKYLMHLALAAPGTQTCIFRCRSGSIKGKRSAPAPVVRSCLQLYGVVDQKALMSFLAATMLSSDMSCFLLPALQLTIVPT
ncbi:hypothetical protein DFJ77DRAFT_468371, partial [Powellomyces hirtus]